MNDFDNKNVKSEIVDKEKDKSTEKEKDKNDKKDKKKNSDEINAKNDKKNIPNDLENVQEISLDVDVDVIINLLFKTDYRGDNDSRIFLHFSKLFRLTYSFPCSLVRLFIRSQ